MERNINKLLTAEEEGKAFSIGLLIINTDSIDLRFIKNRNGKLESFTYNSIQELIDALNVMT